MISFGGDTPSYIHQGCNDEIARLRAEVARLTRERDEVLQKTQQERLSYKDAHGPWADLATQEQLNSEFARRDAERDALRVQLETMTRERDEQRKLYLEYVERVQGLEFDVNRLRALAAQLVEALRANME